MNVYDFDETIFTGDAEDRFFAMMFAKPGFRHYKISFKYYDILEKMHIITKTKRREGQYRFLKDIKDLDAVMKEYWDENEQHMKSWYINGAKRDDDVIASGTPRFILEPIVKKLGIGGLVATEMDTKTGKIDGDFAIGKYKVVNFKNQYGLDCIDNFYSDAYSDHYIAAYAKTSFIIHGENDECTEWNEYFAAHPDLIKED